MIRYFHQGRYQDLISSFEADKNQRQKIRKVGHYYLSALCIVGPEEKASSLFKSYLPGLAQNQIVFITFYLGITQTRASRYNAALENFKKNVKVLSSNKDKVTAFYAFQGMAFYRYFCCRYGRAYLWAKRAFQIANLLEESSEKKFLLLLNTELLGHLSVRRGEISQGLEFFKQSMNFAKQIANKNLYAATIINLLLYKCANGLLKNPLLHLKKAIYELHPEDTYSKANLTIEYVRQLLLHGKIKEAKLNLHRMLQDKNRKGVNTILSFHRRQKAMLYFQMAYLSFLEGKDQKSLKIIKNALSLLHLKIDLREYVKLLGLKNKIIGNTPERQILIEEITDLMEDDLASRYLDRTILSQDKIGVFLMQENIDYQHFLKAREKGWWGLVYKKLIDLDRFARGKRVAMFSPVRNEMIFIDPFLNVLEKIKLTEQVQKLFLLLLEKGAISKEEILSYIWGVRDYNPHLHESFFNTALFRLRKELKLVSTSVIASQGKYYLSPAPYLLSQTLESHKVVSSTPILSSFANVNEDKLNQRQVTAIQLMQSEEKKYFSNKDYQQIFSVTAMTAFRDLKELVGLNVLKTRGKGPGLVYVYDNTTTRS